jgi:hypothetical protein
MGFNYILPLRIAQLVLAFAVLVSAAVAVHYDFDASSEPAFMVFVVRTIPPVPPVPSLILTQAHFHFHSPSLSRRRTDFSTKYSQ